MNTLILFMLLVAASFTLLFLAFTALAKKYARTEEFSFVMMPFPYIFTVYALGSGLLYLFLPNKDFIEPLTLIRVLVPLGCAAVIFLSHLLFSPIISGIILTACISGTVFIQPLGEGFLYDFPSLWIARLLLVAFFTIFCFFYKILGYLSQTATTVSILILCCLAVLSFLGAAPSYIAFCAALLIGALASYLHVNFNSTEIYFDNGSLTALAYLICSLMLLDTGEFSFSSCLIFSSLFWAELIYALWNRLNQKNLSLAECTSYAEAAQKYTMSGLLTGICKAGFICLFLGWFQLFSANQYSLFIVALVMLLWLNSTLAETNKKMSLKETNLNLIRSIKNNFNEAKDIFSSLLKKDK